MIGEPFLGLDKEHKESVEQLIEGIVESCVTTKWMFSKTSTIAVLAGNKILKAFSEGNRDGMVAGLKEIEKEAKSMGDSNTDVVLELTGKLKRPLEKMKVNTPWASDYRWKFGGKRKRRSQSKRKRSSRKGSKRSRSMKRVSHTRKRKSHKRSSRKRYKK
jgi:hypothetical protein